MAEQKASEKVQETTRTLAKSVREAGQAVADTAVAAQERNVKFAQTVFEHGLDVLKNHTEETTAMLQEVEEQFQKQQGLVQSFVDRAAAMRERNMRYARSVVEEGSSVLKHHSDDLHTLIVSLEEQTKKQQEALQTLAHESVDSYVSFFMAPYTYFEKTLEAAQSMAAQNIEAAQKIAKQSMDVAQKASRQGMESAQRLTQQAVEGAPKVTGQTKATK